MIKQINTLQEEGERERDHQIEQDITSTFLSLLLNHYSATIASAVAASTMGFAPALRSASLTPCLGNWDAQELPSTCKKHTNVHQSTPFPALKIDKHCLNLRQQGQIDECKTYRLNEKIIWMFNLKT
jgi:hypothetical protein